MNNQRRTDFERPESFHRSHRAGALIAFCVFGGTLVLSGCGGGEEPVQPTPVEEVAADIPLPREPAVKRETDTGPDISEVRVPAGHTVWSPEYAGALLGLDGKVYEGYSLPAVARVQQALRDKGFYPGEVDSDFDRDTMEAVADFQALHKLNLTGVPTPLTRRALMPAREASLKSAQGFLVQVGVFGNSANSERLIKRLRDMNFDAQAAATGTSRQVVRVGPFQDRRSAEQTAQAIQEATGLAPLVRSY